MYKLSVLGAQDLKNDEGLRLISYHCPAGKLTIGYGHRLMPGEAETITLEQAENYFTIDTERVLKELWSEGTSLTQHRVDALVSFIYNIGIGAWRGSGAKRDMDARNYHLMPQELKRWIHDDHGHVIAGLVTRRAREAALFERV